MINRNRITGYIKKSLAVCLAGISIMSFSGCSKGIYISTGLSKDELFKINGSVCNINEAMLFLTTEKNLYEESYGSEIWDKNLGGVTLQDYIKDNVKSELAEMKCMNLLAKKKKIELTDDEIKDAEASAEKYYKGLTKEEKKYMNINKKTVADVYKQYLLAKNVYGELTKDINPEISDSEAKVIKVHSIYAKTFTSDKDGNRTEYSDIDKADVKKNMEAFLTQINNGDDFDTIAANNTDADEIEYQFGKGEMIQEFEDVAFSLKADEISGVVETKDGYYIIKCISDYMQDETAENKQKMINDKKDSAFKKIYDPFVKSVTSEFNDKAWDKIDFDDMKNIKVSDFYSDIASAK